MADSLTLLREACAKAEAKANRLRLQLNAAETEHQELTTAIRVLERLEGTSGATPPPVTDNAAAILKHVGFGKEEGRPPIVIFEALVSEGRSDLNADLVRTQLWRMAKRNVLESENGRYWRPQAEKPYGYDDEAPAARAAEASEVSGPADGSQRRATHLDVEGSIPSGSTPVRPQPAFDSDLDDDVPF